MTETKSQEEKLKQQAAKARQELESNRNNLRKEQATANLEIARSKKSHR
ncbi:hypothetical protein [Bdellovibrio bacteriovorus]